MQRQRTERTAGSAAVAAANSAAAKLLFSLRQRQLELQQQRGSSLQCSVKKSQLFCLQFALFVLRVFMIVGLICSAFS